MCADIRVTGWQEIISCLSKCDHASLIGSLPRATAVSISASVFSFFLNFLLVANADKQQKRDERICAAYHCPYGQNNRDSARRQSLRRSRSFKVNRFWYQSEARMRLPISG